jgi:hypothetical protein
MFVDDVSELLAYLRVPDEIDAADAALAAVDTVHFLNLVFKGNLFQPNVRMWFSFPSFFYFSIWDLLQKFKLMNIILAI